MLRYYRVKQQEQMMAVAQQKIMRQIVNVYIRSCQIRRYLEMETIDSKVRRRIKILLDKIAGHHNIKQPHVTFKEEDYTRGPHII